MIIIISQSRWWNTHWLYAYAGGTAIMSLSEGEFLRFLSMDLSDFLEEYGRLLKGDLRKARSLSAMASVYIQSANELLRTGNQKQVPLDRGYVYLLSARNINIYKIGSFENGIESSAEPSQQVLVLEFMKSANPFSDQRRIQSLFQSNKVTKDWFSFSEAELSLVRQQFA